MIHTENSVVTKLTDEQEAKLRESFKRFSPETLEAILRFRRERDLDAVIVSIHGIIERYLKFDPGEHIAQRPDTTRLGEDLGIDSLTMLEIVMSIEEGLDFRAEDSDVRNIRTLGDVRRYVDDRVHGRPVSIAMIETYDRYRLCLILPQQPPFLFLDKAELQGDAVRATYLFRGDEFFFPGHFLNDPVVPASIVYEALGQACCLWMLEQVPSRLQQTPATNQLLFVGMDEARFFRRAKPNDEIHISLTLTRLRAPLAIFSGQVKVQNQLLARVEGLTLAFGDFNPAAFDAAPKAAVNSPSRNGAEVSARV
ncbi:phosphopantetheine-binding protein [Pseudomonas sp.]|uniref:phosphopantetheine-binding protein n=1 Tax=Pseudomonas sp. TaxID=306 RepID=UPI003C4805DF